MPARRVLSAMFLPGALAALGLWLAHAPQAEGLRSAPWLPEAPYLVLGLAAAFALRFHRANLAYVAAVLAGACATLQFLAPDAPRLLAPLAILLPLDLVIFMADSPPPVTSRPGLLRVGFVALQAAVLVGLAHPTLWMEYTGGLDAPPADVAMALGGSLLPQGWPPLRPAMLAWGAAAAVAIHRLLRSPGPLEGSVLPLLAAAAGAFVDRDAAAASAWQFCAAGAILASALVQHSYNLAYLDELTGLPGRRALKEELAGLRGRYVLAMLDVDHFKGFNDTYGHDVGDQVLRLVASRMRKAAGPGRPFRYGGEEFTMLYPGRSLGDVMESLEAVRRAVEETPMVLRSPDRPKKGPSGRESGRTPRKSKKVTLTISIGAATPDARRRTPEQVMKAADEALYQAKEQGRNRVCAAGR